MKIAFTSDLHVDVSPDNLKLVNFLIERVHTLKPDVFIIAGDVAANTQLFEKALQMFSDISCSKLFVAGNHDIWVDSLSGLEEGIHSGTKYYELLPQFCEHNGFTYLGLEPHVIDGIGFAGTLGWYICGHSHIKSHLDIGKVRAMKSSVGYPREWHIKNLRTLAEERLDCFEIP